MKRNFIIAIALFSLIWISCHKNKNTFVNYQKGINASKYYAQGQQMMTLLMNTYFKSISDSVLFADGKSKIDGADIFYFDEPIQRILIQYPPWGNADGYGHWRENSYEASTPEHFNDSLALVTFVFTDFSYDKDTLMVKNMTLLNMGKKNKINEQYNLKADQIDLLYSDTTLVFSFGMAQMFLKFKDPSSLYHTANDSFAIWGNMDGQTNDNMSFTSEISPDSTLMDNFSCNWLRQGPAIINTAYFQYVTTVIFSAQGNCENQFMAFINGNAFFYPIDNWNGK